jgi:meromycolic acid enoyl-[acyl-carrier protein] reductase
VLLQGKRILVTGVLNDASIAFSTARVAQEQGAEVVLSSFGRVMRLTERTAKRLPTPDVQIVELDVTNETDLAALAGAVGGKLDGVLHSLAFAPESCLGGGFLDAPWSDVSTALQVSAYSLKALAVAALPLMAPGGSIVGLDFDNDDAAWPFYDWMGVSKAAFESVARYLARDLGPRGIRVNLVSAGPYRSIAAKSIPGFERFEEVWTERAPLGWDLKDAEPIAKACVALMSDWFPATTGEMVHVDGGFHAVGA